MTPERHALGSKSAHRARAAPSLQRPTRVRAFRSSSTDEIIGSSRRTLPCRAGAQHRSDLGAGRTPGVPARAGSNGSPAADCPRALTKRLPGSLSPPRSSVRKVTGSGRQEACDHALVELLAAPPPRGIRGGRMRASRCGTGRCPRLRAVPPGAGRSPGRSSPRGRCAARPASRPADRAARPGARRRWS